MSDLRDDPMGAGPSEILVFDRELLAAREYWLDRLGDGAAEAAAAGLPHDVRARDPEAGRRRAPLTLDADLVAALDALTGGDDLLLHAALTTGVVVCLHRYTRRPKVTVGSPARKRERGQAVRNVLPILAEIGPDTSFRELLVAIRSSLLEAYEHQRYPRARMLEDLGRDDDGGSPLFRVSMALDGLHVRAGRERPEVAVRLGRAAGRLVGTVDFDAGRVDAGSAARFGRHLAQVLRSGIADGLTPVSRLDLLGPGARHQALHEWNDTEGPYRGGTVHGAVAESARRWPDQVAVEFGADHLTYGELHRRSGRLVARLRAAGVGPEDRVGLLLDRSADWIAAALGVLRSGGAFVPLDLEYPADRLRTMAADAGCRALITGGEVAVPPSFDGEVIALTDGFAGLPAPEDPSAETPEDPDPGRLAYVIFTSGSTGRPKGVAVTHRAVLNLVTGGSTPGFGPKETVSHGSNTSFDAAVIEVWGALVSGSRLVGIDRDDLIVPARLAGALRRLRVTTIFLTTSVFHQVVAEDPAHLASVQRMLIGGEAADPRRAAALLAVPGSPMLVNCYGPTETTVFADSARYEDFPEGEPSVPIGRPGANLRSYVLDRDLQPVPVNVPGELFLAGEQLARGYLGRPSTTAVRFVPDPFAAAAGGRLYRTGDLVRTLPGGELDFAGRTDDQVKIRGFRVEPGEVESSLVEHPAVAEAVVLPREDASGTLSLVAYVTGQEQAPDTAEVRRFAEERLPGFMVPSAFVALDELPLAPTGKVDRGALPEPGVTASEPAASTARRTPIEELVTEIWSDVLGVERVAPDDDFFELGGHSLLAAKVMARAHRTFRVDLPMRVLFDSPTPAAMAREVEARREGASELPPIEPVERSGRLPLSFSQERLWFIHQFDVGSKAYNVAAPVRLDGPLDLPAVAAALQGVIDRHETLRTTFAEHQGTPVQVIRPGRPVLLPVVDLSGLPEERATEEARGLAEVESSTPFDLEEGPLMRFTVLRLAERSHVTLLTQHHIVGDGWSLEILVRELDELYHAATEDRAPRLPDLPIQYADFAAWQRRWLEGPVLESQVGYWRERLEGSAPVLDLPLDRPRPAVRDYHGERIRFHLPPSVAEALADLGRRQGVTMFMTVLAVFDVLLHRYTGQVDINVGIPTAGRRRMELENLIGFFVNTLVIRNRVAGDLTFADLLDGVRESVLGAHAHQDLPFEKLVEVLEPERSTSFTPLVQAMAIVQHAEHRGDSELFGLKIEAVQAEVGTAKFDLTLFVTTSAHGLSCALHYDAALFDDTTAERIARSLRRLLVAVSDGAERPLSQIPMLGEPERHQLLTEWGTRPTPRPFVAAHRSFEERARAMPDAVAIVHGEEALSFGELDRRATAIARRLGALGVGPEDSVGLLLDRSVAVAAGTFGIWKAGGVFVPLDPEYPAERLDLMMRDAEVSVVVTRERLRGRLPDRKARVVLVDAPAHGEERSGAPGFEGPAGPESLAYIIFTSGSTGRPKGVMVPHRALANYAAELERAVHADSPEGLRATLNARLSFDAAIKQLLHLTYGHALDVLPEEVRLDAQALVDHVASRRIDVVDCSPSQLRLLLEAGIDGPGGPGTLLVGGEAVDEPTWRRLAGNPRMRAFNHYGPTEVTVNTTIRRFRTDGPPTLGRPLGNLRLSVLDAERAPAPLGAAGELSVGGAAVTRGYLRSPARTAERFVPDPCSGLPGARVYRTGDLVRHRRDGDLEFLGRIDDQVQVRGFRVELGEVEAALTDDAGVRGAAVVALGAGDRRRLVAYAVPREARPGEAARIRSRLEERLPDYMVPSRIVLLDEIPLTPNGKVDREALPDPGERRDGGAGWGADGPRTPVEEMVAEVWAEVLAVPRIGRRDDFFDLGGHSLLATRVVARLREAFLIELPLRELFDAPVLADLASRIDGRIQQGQGLDAPPIEPVPRDRPLPLSFAQERLWILDRLHPGSAAYNVPRAVELEGPLDVAALESALTAVVRRHEGLRTTFREVDGEPVQVVHPPSTVRIPRADLRDMPPARLRSTAERLIEDEAREPFDLEHGPLLRALLIRLAPERHQLVITNHHAVTDARSSEILLGEMVALYGAARSDREVDLPELPIQYADFAAWQRRWLRGGALDAHLEYWREHLRGAPAVLELPTDRPRPAVRNDRGEVAWLRLPDALARGVAELSREAGTTAFMTLLSAFQVLLHRSSGQDDLTVGTPVSGRNRVETENVVGFFLNTLALRVTLDDDPSFRRLLGRTREATLEGFAHQALPFEKLVDELQPRRTLSASPIFQVMFVLRRAEGGTGGTFEDLEARPVFAETRTSKFDLTLSLLQGAESLSGLVEYDDQLFDAATIRRMIGHFERLLESALEEPGRPVGELPMLAPAERWQLVSEWNDTRASRPGGEELSGLFEEQARRTPDAVALVAGPHRLTYAALDRRADRLAHHLRGLGVGPEVRVGLCLGRGAWMAVAVLAVLKAGGAYVPLDPEYPRRRLEMMLSDSGAAVLVAEEALLERLPEPGALPVVDPERDLGEIDDAPAGRPAGRAEPDSLAYVMYTSGSTGVPKGIVLSHGALANLIRWHRATMLGGVATLQFASLSFDASFHEMFACWATGGSLLLISDEERHDTGALRRALGRERVEKAILPVVVLQQLAEDSLRVGGDDVPLDVPLTEVTTTGEQLVVTRPVIELFERLERCSLHNHYGPAETHVVTAHDLPESPAAWESHPPVGRPIDGTTVYVLDRTGEPVPIGVPGELLLGGVALARGYLGRPAKTAERFAPDPFATEPGSRLYRTGDLARFRPGGAVDFLGRIDHQVKVRGYRVEPAGVESVLTRHPAIDEAVVVPRNDRSGDKRLVAYAVAREGEEPSVAGLREHLGREMPHYMVPSRFVLLDRMPLTPNGKLDRRALPEAEGELPELSSAFMPPESAAETVVADVWRDLLGVERVGLEDDFFELGGHSLTAIRTVARLETIFRVELPVRSLFEAPTVAGTVAALADLWDGREVVEEIAHTHQQVEEMSDDEIAALLGEPVGTP